MQDEVARAQERFTEALQNYAFAVEAAERTRATTEGMLPGRGHEAAEEDRRLVGFYAWQLEEMFSAAFYAP